MAALSMTVEELDELGRRLDAADLTEKQREVLARILQVAASSLGADEDVSGFSRSFGDQNSLGSMFRNSFVSGPNTQPRGVPDAIVIEDDKPEL